MSEEIHDGTGFQIQRKHPRICKTFNHDEFGQIAILRVQGETPEGGGYPSINIWWVPTGEGIDVACLEMQFPQSNAGRAERNKRFLEFTLTEAVGLISKVRGEDYQETDDEEV